MLSIHQTLWEWKEANKTYLEFGEQVKELIGTVRKEKTEKQLSMKDEIPELIITSPKRYREFFKATKLDIQACTGAKKVMIRS